MQLILSRKLLLKLGGRVRLQFQQDFSMRVDKRHSYFKLLPRQREKPQKNQIKHIDIKTKIVIIKNLDKF